MRNMPRVSESRDDLSPVSIALTRAPLRQSPKGIESMQAQSRLQHSRAKSGVGAGQQMFPRIAEKRPAEKSIRPRASSFLRRNASPAKAGRAAAGADSVGTAPAISLPAKIPGMKQRAAKPIACAAKLSLFISI